MPQLLLPPFTKEGEEQLFHLLRLESSLITSSVSTHPVLP